ncbi:uncharacterized protein LOC111919002 [Lactuca sativa]|uniref:uncharacterized protein LOC111919002 n=1 Tax=Lactuca sativa TaxID=4236 RepID=UPI000CB60921|nr:uncharacterized protein LOC111919002 [Lactuca sativa]
MEANHLDSNVLLPPRKRLLACMKSRNGNGNSNSNPPSTSNPMNEFGTRLNNLLSVHPNDNNLSQLKIVEASRSAAEVASKIAIAARALAEKKAVMAAIAMAAAKKALELVAAINEQETSSSTSKKNKRKKHVDVQMLYDNKNSNVENGKTSDEELARQLHHVINRSPRIPKKLKIPLPLENGRINEDENLIKVDEFEEDKGIIGRKRGRMKQKKLPLSICHNRGQLNPNEDSRWKSSESVENIERNSLSKCQVFKETTRLKQNKTIQS